MFGSVSKSEVRRTVVYFAAMAFFAMNEANTVPSAAAFGARFTICGSNACESVARNRFTSASLRRMTKMTMDRRDSQTTPPSLPSRRGWMRDVARAVVAGGTLATLTIAAPDRHAAVASVYVDPDRYGDKELKVGTVNKLRQNIRDAILKDPILAPLFLKVAIQDALKFNAKTEEGGPDGSIVFDILSSSDPALRPLRPAAEKLLDIAKTIKRTTEVTMGDVVGFAGAEAIESAGGPRIVVQLGKLEPKGIARAKVGDEEAPFPDLCSDSKGDLVVGAFLNAGLTEREVALLYGALGAMEKAVTSLEPAEDEVEEEEENEMGDKDIFIPTSFGGPKEIYGKQLGKALDRSIFAEIVADLKKGKKPIADVFTNDVVGEWALKYAGSKGGFMKDLPEAYSKLTALGARYTGGRMGTLLGGQQDAQI